MLDRLPMHSHKTPQSEIIYIIFFILFLSLDLSKFYSNYEIELKMKSNTTIYSPECTSGGYESVDVAKNKRLCGTEEFNPGESKRSSMTGRGRESGGGDEKRNTMARIHLHHITSRNWTT